MVKELLKACPFKRRSQLNSTQEASKRRASRPGPDVFPTKEPQGQSPLRKATVRTVHYFHSTAQPQVSRWSGAGLQLWLVSGGRVGGGGRPVKDLSLRTQAVNLKQGWNLQGQDPSRVRDSESETRYQTKESVTPPKETSSQKVQSTWPPKTGRTSEGFWHPADLACPVWQDK